jgi:hypothetical protein
MVQRQSSKRVFDGTKMVAVEHGFVTPPRPKIWPKAWAGARECMECAVFMASQIELVDHALTNFRPERIRSAYFRASLTELCRMEDLSKELLDPPLNFAATDDPSLHLVKLLRNYQVHIQTMPLAPGAIEVSHRDEKLLYRSFIAEAPALEQLRKLDSAKPYSDGQLIELAAHFSNAQRLLGITQLLYHLSQRVEAYALGRMPLKRPRKHPGSL